MKPEALLKSAPRRYAVFLSYRHADNKEPGRQWATWLHQILENYEVPSDLVGTTNTIGELIPASLYPVFRDEEELPADADLTRNIRQALENSALLVVICSPRAAQSRFVAEEIRYFKELGKANRILALIIDGEPNTTDDPAKRSAELTIDMECLPEPLRRGVTRSDGTVDWDARTEPIAADARPGGQPIQGWTNGAAYREHLLRDGRSGKPNIESDVKLYEERLELTKLKIIAGALSVPLGILTQRDKAMQLERARQRARALRLWLAAVALLAVIAIAGGIFAWNKQSEAAQERDSKEQARQEEEKQRTVAQEQSERRRQMLAEAARSDRLVAEEKLQNDQPADAFAYLARSITYDGTTTLAAEKAIAALNNWKVALPTTFCKVDDYIYSSEFSPDGKLIVTSSPSHPAQIWDGKTGRLVSNLVGDKRGEEDVARTAHFAPDSKLVVAWLDSKRAGLWETGTGKLVGVLQGLDLIFLRPPAEFSPDSKRLVAVTESNKASVWDTDTGNVVAVLKGHAAQILNVSFDPGGRRVVTSSSDQTARVWDALSGKLLFTLAGHDGPVNSALFSPDGHTVITETDQTVRLWQADTGKLVSVFEQQESARFSPDSLSLATVSGDGTVRLWDAKNGRLLRAFTTAQKTPSEDTVLENPTETVEFNPDGHYILSCQKDNAVRLWNASSGELVATFGEQHFAVFSPDGQLLATAAGNKFSPDPNVRIWDVKSGRLQVIAQGNNSPAHALRFSADGRRVVTSSDDKIARVWETQSRLLAVTLRGHQKEVFDAAFSADGRRAVTASDDETARVWDAQSGTLLMTLNGQGKGFVKTAEFSPDGKRILTVSLKTTDSRFDSTTCLWDAETGKLLQVFPSKGETAAMFAPDGQCFAIEEDGAVKLLETTTGKLLRLFPGQSNPSFGPNGKVLATVSGGNAFIWQANTGQPLLTIHAPGGEDRGFKSAVFSRDEKSIVTTSPEINSWSTKDGAHLSKFPGYARNTEFSSDGRYLVTTPPAVRHTIVYVFDVASANEIFELPDQEGASFSPDGQRVVSENLNASADLRETQTGKLVATIRGHNGHLTSVKFSPDGTHLISTGDQETIARISTILSPQAGPPPAWFADFLVYLGQRRLNSAGELVPIPTNEWNTIRDGLRKVVGGSIEHDTPYLRVLRRFVEE